jgi:hypothetical protein
MSSFQITVSIPLLEPAAGAQHCLQRALLHGGHLPLPFTQVLRHIWDHLLRRFYSAKQTNGLGIIGGPVLIVQYFGCGSAAPGLIDLDPGP